MKYNKKKVPQFFFSLFYYRLLSLHMTDGDTYFAFHFFCEITRGSDWSGPAIMCCARSLQGPNVEDSVASCGEKTRKTNEHPYFFVTRSPWPRCHPPQLQLYNNKLQSRLSGTLPQRRPLISTSTPGAFFFSLTVPIRMRRLRCCSFWFPLLRKQTQDLTLKCVIHI